MANEPDTPPESIYLDLTKQMHNLISNSTKSIAIPSVVGPFQKRVYEWLIKCLGAETVVNRKERNVRFLEESLDLVRALGLTEDEMHQLVRDSFDRPNLNPLYQIGDVAVEFAALCEFNDRDMVYAGEAELARRIGYDHNLGSSLKRK